MPEPLLALDDVTAGYGRAAAITDITMEVRSGEIIALLGSNGAGKTTTLRVVSGVVVARSGSVRLDGKLLVGASPRSVVRAGIAHCPEGRRVFPALSVRENIEMGSTVLTDTERRRAVVDEVLDLFPVLRERQDQHGGTLSGGEQQMLAVARALAAEPRLLMLDEPSLGLAPRIIDQFAQLVRDLRDRGTTILLVEQNAALALALADRAYVLENGRVALAGEAEALARDERVRDAYLGSGTLVRRRPRPA